MSAPAPPGSAMASAVSHAWAAGPLGCFLGLGDSAGDVDTRVVSSGPWVSRALTEQRGQLTSFAAIMPSFWDELILMAAPDAVGHVWTRASLTAIMNTVFRRAMEQDRVHISWEKQPDPASPNPALQCGTPRWAVFNTGLHTRSHQQLFARLHPFSAAVVADDLMQDGGYASPKSTKELGLRYSGVVATWRPDGYGRIRVTGTVESHGDGAETKGDGGTMATGGSSGNSEHDTAADSGDQGQVRGESRPQGGGGGPGGASAGRAETGAGVGPPTAPQGGKRDITAQSPAGASKPHVSGGGDSGSGAAAGSLDTMRPAPVHTGRVGETSKPRQGKRLGVPSMGDLVFVHRSQVRVVDGALPILQPGTHVEFFVGINPVTKGKECCVHVTGHGGTPLPGSQPPPFFANRSCVITEEALVNDGSGLVLGAVAAPTFFTPREADLVYDPHAAFNLSSLGRLVEDALPHFVGAALCREADARLNRQRTAVALTNATHGAIHNARKLATTDFLSVVPHFRYQLVSDVPPPTLPGTAHDTFVWQGRLELLLPLWFDSSAPLLALSIRMASVGSHSEYQPTAIVPLEEAWVSARAVSKVHTLWLRRAAAAGVNEAAARDLATGFGSAGSLPTGVNDGAALSQGGSFRSSGASAMSTPTPRSFGSIRHSESGESGKSAQRLHAHSEGGDRRYDDASKHKKAGGSSRRGRRTRGRKDAGSGSGGGASAPDDGGSTYPRAPHPAMVSPARESGRVVTWKPKGAYGFIRPDNAPQESLFVHVSTVTGPPRGRPLTPGDIVEFTPGTNEKTGKAMALHVVVVKASPLQPHSSGRRGSRSSDDTAAYDVRHRRHSGSQGRSSGHNTPGGVRGMPTSGTPYAHSGASAAQPATVPGVATVASSSGAGLAHQHVQQYPVPHGMYWGSDAGAMQGVYPHGVQQVGPMVMAPTHQMMYTTGHSPYGTPTGMHYLVPGYPPQGGSHRPSDQS